MGRVDNLALTQERRVRAAAARRMAMLREESTRLRDEAVWLRNEVTRLHAEIDRQRDYIAAQAFAEQEERQEAKRQIQEVTAALRAMTAGRDRMEEAWRMSAAEHQRLLRSTTWRLTAPLRWAMGHVPPPVRRLLKRG
ncbi:hypothetical protein CTJ15_04010 (plasmid) [Roseomonas sp. FDAARGOS_362]|nr:hypothetical protein CTJ15_04010 [Roseomonas sp. FDAARGOS_362]